MRSSLSHFSIPYSWTNTPPPTSVGRGVFSFIIIRTFLNMNQSWYL
uniref:Uncharacterized protein n=1 Tax=Siphoviridae sp. cthrG7 TaxID=2826428 RepID=A0A8S5MC87_9CAUD|nr:MAG TPA: hypothetical protein [Siphoviridae sp. cthrG7]DAO21559.1 MAG TPA: hypothetical protein [Caudoviricetes sp.]